MCRSVSQYSTTAAALASILHPFLIMALVVFLIVKALNRATAKFVPAEEKKKKHQRANFVRCVRPRLPLMPAAASIATEHPELAERFKERRHVLDEHLKQRRPEVYELVVSLREKEETDLK